MGKHGKTWENMGKHAKTWENMGKHGKTSLNSNQQSGFIDPFLTWMILICELHIAKIVGP